MQRYFERAKTGFVIAWKNSKFYNADSDECDSSIYNATVFEMIDWNKWEKIVNFWNINGGDGNYELVKVVHNTQIMSEKMLYY